MMHGLISYFWKKLQEMLIGSGKFTSLLFKSNHLQRRRDFGEGICIYGLTMLFLRRRLLRTSHVPKRSMKELSNSYHIKSLLLVNYGSSMPISVYVVMICKRREKCMVGL
jgi:hypothetical protein